MVLTNSYLVIDIIISKQQNIIICCYNIAFALAGRMVRVCLLTQGAALGYVVLPLRGVSLATFDTPSAPSWIVNTLQHYCLRRRPETSATKKG